MENPDDRKYAKTHEWCKMEGDVATVGITDHAQHALTDIVFVELPEKGKKVEKGKQMCVVESVKSVSDIIAPVSGKVVEVNSELEKNPETLNKDPFEKGWIAKIKALDPKEAEGLLDAKRYSELVEGRE